VPKQPVHTTPSGKRGGSNILMMIGTALLAVSLLGSAGVFVYERFLIATRNAKSEEVRDAESRVSNETVENFIRSRNRFSVAGTMLDNHVETSRFFGILEGVTLENVRFNTLVLDVLDDNSGKLEMTGVARTFNALAAQSRALAAEKNLKRAIFSDIAVAPNNTVSFSLTAELDPELLRFVVDEAALNGVPVAPEGEETMPAEGEEPLEPAAVEEAPAAAPASAAPKLPPGAVPIQP
jgi:hypothetical protein